MKNVVMMMFGLLAAAPALADSCTVYLQVVGSHDKARKAERKSFERCHEIAAFSRNDYCLSPVYMGKVGYNNDAFRTPLVITRRDRNFRFACEAARRDCYNLARGRDFCTDRP